MAQELTDQRPIFLSTLPAGHHERRIALAVVAVSAAIFAAVAPFAKVQLAPVWAFIPAYESALAVNDLSRPSCCWASSASYGRARCWSWPAVIFSRPSSPLRTR
jgi:hypothetical protein